MVQLPWFWISEVDMQTPHRKPPLSQAPAKRSRGTKASSERKDGAAPAERLVNVAVPSAIVKEVKALLRQHRLGKKVTLVSADEEVTTAKAASILNVSRPHVVKLLDSGKIPSHKVGTHRRVKLKDVLAYKKRQHASNDAVLTDLAGFAQEHGLGW
jgi:excisionase family DNA binding protein